jgi:16S rRNA (uracil1498-N3)-methyltransferase
MDLIVQKATELGVVRIVPLLTERSEVKLDQPAPKSGWRIGARWPPALANRAAARDCRRSPRPYHYRCGWMT